jgi:hypothetical protein
MRFPYGPRRNLRLFVWEVISRALEGPGSISVTRSDTFFCTGKFKNPIYIAHRTIN